MPEARPLTTSASLQFRWSQGCASLLGVWKRDHRWRAMLLLAMLLLPGTRAFGQGVQPSFDRTASVIQSDLPPAPRWFQEGSREREATFGFASLGGPDGEAVVPFEMLPPLAGDLAEPKPLVIDPLPIGPQIGNEAWGFSPPPTLIEPSWDAVAGQAAIYDDRHPVPVQRPWIELGERFYGDGMTRPGGLLFSPTNLTHSKLFLYGDFRVGGAAGRNNFDDFSNLATRLNLDLDWAWTSTERFHAAMGPLNRQANFTQLDISSGDVELDAIFNPNFVTGFFEGDLGYMFSGLMHRPAEFELPIAAGLMPLFHQNGIWMDDAVTGIAIAQNAKHSRLLNWSNYDATLFAIFDQLNSPAFGADPHAAQALGTAWFIEAYEGYFEIGYAFLNDRLDQGRSYHNSTIAFTRRYFDRIGNSLRLIVNSGQDLPQDDRTADGGVLLVENYLVTATPLTVVPYMNMFYGWGRPQSVARNALAGDILRNVGIAFETDGLNGFPTLDATAINTYGGAVGLNLLGAKIDRQFILEASLVHGYGAPDNRLTQGDQYGLAARYQKSLSHCTLIRFDTLYGWRVDERDLMGARCEYRYKF